MNYATIHGVPWRKYEDEPGAELDHVHLSDVRACADEVVELMDGAFFLAFKEQGNDFTAMLLASSRDYDGGPHTLTRVFVSRSVHEGVDYFRDTAIGDPENCGYLFYAPMDAIAAAYPIVKGRFDAYYKKKYPAYVSKKGAKQ